VSQQEINGTLNLLEEDLIKELLGKVRRWFRRLQYKLKHKNRTVT
jgi:hypothetical protein